jgi:hypothetical protein
VRHSRALLLAATALAAWPTAAHAQQSRVIRRLEKAVWARISDRALQTHAITLDSGQFDLRLPITGEVEEIRSATASARDARAVASARFEPSDPGVDPRDTRDAHFIAGRYDLRLEDRIGHCVAVHQDIHIGGDGGIIRGARMVERCRPLYMADVVRRARRLAHLPLEAGRLTDHWSVSSALSGWADVYADSVVILATSLTLQASYPPANRPEQHVDSIAVGLALGDSTWDIARRSAALHVDTTLSPQGTWSRRQLRFTIPIDSTFALRESWPVVDVMLAVPRTASNTIGRSWTYGHGPKPFFAQTAAPSRRP